VERSAKENEFERSTSSERRDWRTGNRVMPPVILNHETHQRIAAYAKVTDKSVASAVDEAVNEWMDINGEPIMKSVERKKKAQTCRLLAFRTKQKMQ
jgi:hypothetical protein